MTEMGGTMISEIASKYLKINWLGLGEFERFYISKVETGVRSIHLITIVQLSLLLQITPSKLVEKVKPILKH